MSVFKIKQGEIAMKKRWKEILFIVVAAVVILGMGSTAVANVKGLIKGDETESTQENNSTAIICVDEAL